MRTRFLTVLVMLASAAAANWATARHPIDGELANRLQAMRQEEKLARDVYRALHRQGGEQVFANISRAEQQHMDAIKQMLQKYGIPDPIAQDVPGRFPSPVFQEMYDRLVRQGSTSPQAAIQVGLLIEEMDIADLREFRREVNQPDLDRVLMNLERGSRNHLRAFANRLRQMGGTYQPTHLDANEFAQIANSPNERGGPPEGRGAERSGRGNGQGQGGQGGQGGRRGGRGGRGGGQGKSGGGF